MRSPIETIRRNLRQLQDLANAGHLTPERVRSLTRQAEASLNEAAEQLREEGDSEHFEITLEGLQAMTLNGKPARWRGHLFVVDGDRA